MQNFSLESKKLNKKFKSYNKRADQIQRCKERWGGMYCKGSCICFSARSNIHVYKQGQFWNHSEKNNISDSSVNKYKLKRTYDMAVDSRKLKYGN